MNKNSTKKGWKKPTYTIYIRPFIGVITLYLHIISRGPSWEGFCERFFFFFRITGWNIINTSPYVNGVYCSVWPRPRMPVANKGLGWDSPTKNVRILVVTGILGGGHTQGISKLYTVPSPSIAMFRDHMHWRMRDVTTFILQGKLGWAVHVPEKANNFYELAEKHEKDVSISVTNVLFSKPVYVWKWRMSLAMSPTWQFNKIHHDFWRVSAKWWILTLAFTLTWGFTLVTLVSGKKNKLQSPWKQANLFPRDHRFWLFQGPA